ncbi:MAG: hypothetical protein M1822_006538 [Bathelium mastoideum]|nr:MAG: hypothetical protein M1822_006538 [Bathelium mastoideum]
MESINSRQNSVTITPTKPDTTVAVNEVAHSDSDSSTQSPRTEVATQEQTLSRTTSSETTWVMESTQSIRTRIVRELDDVDAHYFDRVDQDSYLEFIANERLIHMPRKGTAWDQVLKAAEFFGLQICSFGKEVSRFVHHDKYVVHTALGSCLMLLELGHNNAPALRSTFNALYEFGFLVSQSLQNRSLFTASREIQDDLSDIFKSLVELVGDIAVHYRTRLNSMSSHQTVSIDFNAVFGKSVDRIWIKKQHLFNHLWSSKLGNKRYAYSIEQIRHKLSPVDESARALLSGRLADKAERTEGTCEWIQGDLLDFLRSKEKTFTITGASGHGKSMLAAWIKDRLRRTLGRVSYETLSHTFANDARSEATPIALLKHLLSQLLERNVGDIRLYESLIRAFEANSKNAELENSLWDALRVGLKTVQDQKSAKDQKSQLVIIIDGLDEVTGHEAALRLHKRLHECVGQFNHVRAITLSKPISHLGLAGSRHLVITPEHNEYDIALYLHESLSRHSHFKSQDQAIQDELVKKLVKKAQGSFLWAYLAVYVLNRENSYGALSKAGQEIPSSVHAILHRLIGHVDLKNTTTAHLFEILLAAQRPLTIGEMKELLGIDLQRRTVGGSINVHELITTHCAGLVVIRNGLIRFKHSAIRHFFLHELSGKALASLDAAHTALTQRLLFYVKCRLTASDEPSFDVLGWSVLEDNFSKHLLLGYIVRNWVTHFHLSTLRGKNGEVTLASGFKDVVPASPFFCLLQWSYWQQQLLVSETIEHLDLILQINKAAFGEKDRSVLQTMIILGTIHRSMSNQIKAAEFFYHASIVGQVVLHKYSTIVITCTSYFLSCTEKIEITKRTEIVSYRETMILLMIDICKSRHGAHSDQVIKWYEVLVDLYIKIEEKEKATAISKELYEIIVLRYGRNHPKARGFSEKFDLTVVLTGGSETSVQQYDKWLFETIDDLEDTDELRISVILRMCHGYEHRGEWFLAEEQYIKLWRRISEICRVQNTIELQITKINITLEYVRFLQRTKRVEEAQSILLCLWAEFEHHACDNETLIIRIKELGIVFKSFGLLTVAVSVFGKVWAWFKSKNKTTHEEAFATTVLITEVVEEIEITTISKKTTTKTVVTETETVIREVYETHYERCRHSQIDIHFLKASLSLIEIYLAQEKWSESETVIKRTLELTWKVFLTVDAKITLSGTYVKETIRVATQLAICYHHQRHFEKAEEIYLRIYRACLASFSIDHVCVTEASLALIHFYEEYHQHEKVIAIYTELLQGYRQHCGASHHLTIQTLYALGSLCLMLGRKDAYKYYIDIVTVLNKNSTHCHHDAFTAAIIVSRHYYEEKRWIELRKICAVLWDTFVHHSKSFNFTEEIITTLYERYIYVLEFHAKVEFSVLYKLTVEYRETVTKRFGASSAIVIKALLALAIICEKHEDHYHESITIYEEIITRTKTTTTETTVIEETTIKTVRKRLSKMYVTVITTGKATSTTTVERGLVIALEFYEQLKLEFGCWHETTLAQLREVVILYHKQGKHEATIVCLLQSVVIETLIKVTESITLYHAAATIGSIYLSVGMAKAGHDLLHQLRHLIVLHDMASSIQITISIGKISKVAFVFLIAFELALTSKPVLSYSEVMADILLEAYLYESYTRIIKSSSSVEKKLRVGASLHAFWIVRSRTAQAEILARSLFTTFQAGFKDCLHAPEPATYTFFIALLAVLGHDTRDTSFSHLVCHAAETKVSGLISTGNFTTANEVAIAAFHIISARHYFREQSNVPYGYRIAAALAGLDTRSTNEPKVHAALLATSRTIATAVLTACRAANIDFAALRFEDVAGLVRLLGAQENYGELEFLLLRLWNSREVQRAWNADTVLRLGESLVHAHSKAGHVREAAELCDVICYNLRRSRGWLEPEALRMSKLLAELQTELGQYAKAMGVHEEVLREIDEEGDGEKGVDAALASHMLELLKRDYARLGKWEKSERGYAELVQRVGKKHGVNVSHVEHWQKGQTDDFGKYKGIGHKDFRIDQNETEKKEKSRTNEDRSSIRKSRLLKAATRRSFGFVQ